MKKFITLLSVLLLIHSVAMAQSFLRITTKDGTTDIPAAYLDSVIIRDVDFYGEVWHSIGFGRYTEDIISSIFDLGCVTYDVEIEESYTRPGVFRLVNPYGPAYPYNSLGTYDNSQKHYMEIDARNPNAVLIKKFYTGLDFGYGEMLVWSVADYYLSNGKAESAAGAYGKLNNGKITFPVSSLIISLPNYNDGALFTANSHALFEVILPGFNSRTTTSTVAPSQSRGREQKPQLNTSSKVFSPIIKKGIPQSYAPQKMTDKHGVQKIIIK